MAKKQVLPGYHHRRSVVGAPVPVEQGGSLRGSVDYIVETWRHEGKWNIKIQFIDLDNNGHIVTLPDAVVQRLQQQQSSIMSDCKKERSRNAAHSRKLKGNNKAQERKWDCQVMRPWPGCFEDCDIPDDQCPARKEEFDNEPKYDCQGGKAFPDCQGSCDIIESECPHLHNEIGPASK